MPELQIDDVKVLHVQAGHENNGQHDELLDWACSTDRATVIDEAEMVLHSAGVRMSHEVARETELEDLDDPIIDYIEVLAQTEYEQICKILGAWGLNIDPHDEKLPPHVQKQIAIEASWHSEPNLPG